MLGPIGRIVYWEASVAWRRHKLSPPARLPRVKVSGTACRERIPLASPAAAFAPAERQGRILRDPGRARPAETGATSVAIGLICDGGVTCRATAAGP